MTPVRHPFHIVLVVLCLAHLAALVWRELGPTLGIEGFLYPDGTPVGADFINLWSVGRLVLEGRLDVIYRYDAFMAYQMELTGAQIGHRIWAYPPHSLLFAWPFGLFGFYVTFALWSLVGLLVLGWGCVRLGLGRWETAIVLLSPASVLCIYYGQTGNPAAGLLMLALSARPGRDVTSIGAALVLTIKPQMGFLLPFFWLAQKRWVALIGTSALVVLVLLGALVWSGVEVWSDYVGETLAELSLLERHGTGPFMNMIPSIFMSVRILTGDGDLALLVHFFAAIPIVAYTFWRLWTLSDPVRRITLVLAATAIITPYLHNYDLTLIVVAALLILRRFQPESRGELAICLLAGLALGLPQLVVAFNALDVPLAPLILLPLLLLA